MRIFKLAIAVLVIAVALFIMLPNLAWAENVGDLFKAKCVGCHGADGKADTAIGKKLNIAEFNSEKVQKAPDVELVDFILNGGKDKRASHAFASQGISEAQAKGLARYVKDLGKHK